MLHEVDYIRYTLNDQSDECFPFTVEGKWLLKLSKSEQLEEMIENEVLNDPSKKTNAELKNEITDNDSLIAALEAEISRLTDK